MFNRHNRHEKRPSISATIAIVAPLIAPEASRLAAATGFLLVASVASLAFPQGIQLILSEALDGATRTRVDTLAAKLAVLAVAHGIFAAARAYLFAIVGERFVSRLRTQLFQSLLAQEIGFYDEQTTGELNHRLSSDTAVLQATISVNFSMGLRSLVLGVGALAMLFHTSAALALLVSVLFPFVAILVSAHGQRVRALSKATQDTLAKASSVAEEALAGIRTVRGFAAEERELRRYCLVNDEGLQLAHKTARAGAAFVYFSSASASAVAVLAFWLGGRQLSAGLLSVDRLTVFVLYALQLAYSLVALAEVWPTLNQALGASERVFELLRREPQQKDEQALVPERIDGNVRWHHVNFAYPSRRETEVLRDLCLTVNSGEVVAIVGPSGAGKSTIASLLCRFYDPTNGELQLDGVSLRTLNPRWLRQQIAMVHQETYLFSCSIAENIAYGRVGATREDIIAASRSANADSFIMEFPLGYDTLVGERGVQLSGGQRQRVAIARALLKNPRILILDEATSALDSANEHLVFDALQRLMRGRTTIIVAHRLSTVRGAHRVVVLDRGEIVQQGSHTDLLSKEGMYRRLVVMQLVDSTNAPLTGLTLHGS